MLAVGNQVRTQRFDLIFNFDFEVQLHAENTDRGRQEDETESSSEGSQSLDFSSWHPFGLGDIADEWSLVPLQPSIFQAHALLLRSNMCLSLYL
jgi:hypothetical protein